MHLISLSLILLVSDRDPRTNRSKIWKKNVEIVRFGPRFFLVLDSCSGPRTNTEPLGSGSTDFGPCIPCVRYIKSNLGSKYNHDVECKLRVLDSFGTDEIFNDRNSKIKNNGWGKLGLNLKQFWTFYPHNQERLVILKSNASQKYLKSRLETVVHGP